MDCVLCMAFYVSSMCVLYGLCVLCIGVCDMIHVYVWCICMYIVLWYTYLYMCVVCMFMCGIVCVYGVSICGIVHVCVV